MATAERRNIEGGVTLRGWLFVPNAKGPAPAITMAHGYAGVKEHGIERFARAFAEAGFVALVHDHRNFGASDGVERGDVDPWQQIADWRRAISFLESQPEVDAAQIGLWGTSYAGGHAIVLATTDRRLRAVVGSNSKRGQSTNLDRLDEMGELKRWRDKSESSLRARCTM
jgi:uncharacterized protein